MPRKTEPNKTREVTVRVNIYEIDGKEAPCVPPSILTVASPSHRNRESMVVLTFGATTVTVSADDLADAVKRARGR
jgi:hypothetical protein